VDVCRYISFTGIRNYVTQAQPFIRYLKPDFLDDLSEACVPEDT
jgi:hypothetical protein